MGLIHGENISAGDVERLLGEQGDARSFAAICNALLAAQSPTVLSLTERVNVGDNGIDGECPFDLTEQEAAKSPLFSPGWNVVQYKQREVAAQGRRQVITQRTNLSFEVAFEAAQSPARQYPDKLLE